MPGWLVSIFSILGVVEQVAPIVEQLLSGIGTFIANELSKVFGQDAAASKLTGIVAQAETGVAMLDTFVGDVEAELKAIYPTVESLFAAFPGLAKSLTLRKAIVEDNPGVSHATAAKVVEAAHANVRVNPSA